MEAQRWRREWGAGGIGPEFGESESTRERCSVAVEGDQMLNTKVVMVGGDVGREPMAGSVDAVMGCRSGRLVVRCQAVAGGFGAVVGVVFVAVAMLMRCMIAVMADAGCRLGARHWLTMIAATEDAVREHVQAGQDGDQSSHVESEGKRMSAGCYVSPVCGNHSLAHSAFIEPTQFFDAVGARNVLKNHWICRQFSRVATGGRLKRGGRERHHFDSLLDQNDDTEVWG